MSSSSLIHGSENLPLERYRERNNILHDLIRKECPSAEIGSRRNKNDDFDLEIEATYLEVEKLLYERMIRVLVACRSINSLIIPTEASFKTTTTPTYTEDPTMSTTTSTYQTTPNSTESTDPCVNAVNFDESWRRDCSGSRLKPIDGDYNCDTKTILEEEITWFRFSGAAGNRLRDTCPPSYSCGTRAGFWSNATMPTSLGETKDISVYASWSGECDYGTLQVKVMRCSLRAHDYVYLYEGGRWCDGGFCGMD